MTITSPEMTRFLLSLDDAVSLIFAAVAEAGAGETYVPKVPAARVADIAAALIGDRQVETKVIGIRPGEKVHEILISEEECWRTVSRGTRYVVLPALPELKKEEPASVAVLGREYSSKDELVPKDEVRALLERNGLLVEQVAAASTRELLR